MTDLWSYRTPTGDVVTLERVWDDDAGEWVYVHRNDQGRLVMVTAPMQEQAA